MISTVYRLENLDGIGIFTGLGGVRSCAYFLEDTSIHVGPFEDRHLMRNLSRTGNRIGEHLFGVEQVRLLEGWISNKETLEWLADHNFRLATYFPAKIVRGTYQCMFLKNGEFVAAPLFKDLRVAAKEFNWFDKEEGYS